MSLMEKKWKDTGSESAMKRSDSVCSSEHELEKASSHRRVTFQDEETGASSDDEEAVRKLIFVPWMFLTLFSA